MVHGDLKGVCLQTQSLACHLAHPFIKANILIDQNGIACLADFGLLTIASDSADPTVSNSFVEGGTTQWMSPELFDPDQFGSKDNRPTKESDCYAFGMVIYEVLSGRAPFTPHRSPTVIQKVTKGERPTRPEGVEGAWFTDDLWAMLMQCWAPQPKNRPSIEAVLECLEPCSRAWRPPPPQEDEDAAMGNDDRDFTTMSDFSSIISHFSRETKKALLVGISYHKGKKGQDLIPTSIPNAKKFATFLRGERSPPPSILSCLRSPSASSRVLWVYGHCFNDR